MLCVSSAWQAQSRWIWIYEICLLDTKTKRELLLSTHPWVSLCAAELNMSLRLSAAGASALSLLLASSLKPGCV